MTPQAREQLRAELTDLVQRRRGHYLRLKGAGREITYGELSEARSDYQRALVLLNRFLEQAGDHPQCDDTLYPVVFRRPE